MTSNAVAVSAGDGHSLYVSREGTLWAMGRNWTGQLGQEWGNYWFLPVAVANGVTAVAAGLSHTLFITADGSLWAMGGNNLGQLGVGDLVDRFSPVFVASDVVTVAAGGQHSLFVKSDGTLWAMGFNGLGQLGNGTNINQTLPVAIATNVTAARAGNRHSLFTKNDGTLWAVGNNSYGQLGNGTTASTNLAVLVTNEVVAIAAGYYHSLFAKADGSLWSMGASSNGELGIGTLVNTNRPTRVTGFTTASLCAIDTSFHSLAVGISAPWISGLKSIKAHLGQTISLNPNTGGSGPLLYQWQFNGNDIVGATNSVFSIPSFKSADGGLYTVTVTGPAGFTSSSVSLYIYGVVTWTSTTGANGPQLDLGFTGKLDRSYTLQSATNLLAPVIWETVTSKLSDLDGHCLFTITNLSGPQKFYRIYGPSWP